MPKCIERTNDGATESDILAEVDITSDSQVVKLDNGGDLLESLLELSDLLEMITELDNRSGVEHSLLVKNELTMLKRVDIRFDQKEIRTRLDGQETCTRDVDTMCIPEMLDSSSSSSLKLYTSSQSAFLNGPENNDVYLNNSLTIIGSLGVNDDIKIHSLGIHDALQSLQVDPQVVGVEDLELADGLEVLDVL